MAISALAKADGCMDAKRQQQQQRCEGCTRLTTMSVTEIIKLEMFRGRLDLLGVKIFLSHSVFSIEYNKCTLK